MIQPWHACFCFLKPLSFFLNFVFFYLIQSIHLTSVRSFYFSERSDMRGEPFPSPFLQLLRFYWFPLSLLMIPTARRDDGQNGATRCLYGWVLMKAFKVFVPRPLYYRLFPFTMGNFFCPYIPLYLVSFFPISHGVAATAELEECSSCFGSRYVIADLIQHGMYSSSCGRMGIETSVARHKREIYLGLDTVNTIL